MNKSTNLPKSNISVDQEKQKIRDMFSSGKELLINTDGTIGENANFSSNDTVTKVKTMPEAILSVEENRINNVQDLINEMRGTEATKKDNDEVEGIEDIEKKVNTSIVPKAIVSAMDLSNSIVNKILLNNSGDEIYTNLKQKTKTKYIPKTVLSFTQWYVSNPKLLEAEKAAMYDYQGNKAKFGYMRNGKAYWQIHCHPIIGNKEKSSCRAYDIALVYDDDHPQSRCGSSIKAYLLKPTIEDLQLIVNKTPGIYPKNIPHILKDSNGELYICSVDASNTSSSLESKSGITSAATSLRFALRWINVFEYGLIDHIGTDSIWSRFQRHGEI